MDRRALLGSETAGVRGFRRSGPNGMWRWRHVCDDRIYPRRGLFRTWPMSLALIIAFAVAAVVVVQLGGGPVNPEAGLLAPAIRG